MTTHPYCSFLLRCWRLGTESQRIEIEHIHSGDRSVVASFDAAVAWMTACSEDPPAAPGSSVAPPADNDVRFDGLTLRAPVGKKD